MVRVTVHTKEMLELSVSSRKSTKSLQFFEILPLLDAARRLRDAEQNRRREELQRRIEETRMKLQNVSILYLNSIIHLLVQ